MAVSRRIRVQRRSCLHKMGVGAVKRDIKAMILTGFAGLVAGACSMAIGGFISVYSQLDRCRDRGRRTVIMSSVAGEEGGVDEAEGFKSGSGGSGGAGVYGQSDYPLEKLL